MIGLALPRKRGTLSVLCLGAHADDIEIGCGGTILHLTAERRATVHWAVLSANARRAAEARTSAQRFLRGASGDTVEVASFRDGYFPTQRAELKDWFVDLRRRVTPDLIFTHHEGDLHQDHEIVAKLTRETFRERLILEYEIPKYDGGLGSPHVFVPMDARTRRRKLQIILQAFGSQRSKRWFSEETFLAMMRLRGVESGVRSGYAEGFYARKLVLGG